jgi:hypothetical protein
MGNAKDVLLQCFHYPQETTRPAQSKVGGSESGEWEGARGSYYSMAIPFRS